MFEYFTGQVPVIVLAVLFDLLIGDPQFALHPVRLVGGLIARTERFLRWCGGPQPRRAYLLAAGIVTVIFTVSIAAAAAAGLLALARTAGELPALLVAVFLVWSAMAVRDLHVSARRVRLALQAGDLPAAREHLACIVGRDTSQLDQREIVRATVETVAEGTCDGIIAPLLFAALGGPVLAVAYRAVNTLDSMIGHKDAAYRHFGWFAARLDDGLNYLPARLTALLLAAATLLSGRGRFFHPFRQALAIAWRDAGAHPSPNAGWPEAAAAGALGLRLGGTSWYAGQPCHYPSFGDSRRSAEAADIDRVCRLMFGATLCFCALLALPLAMGILPSFHFPGSY